MSQTFNIRRFSLLFRKTLLERPVQITGLCALMLLVVWILYFACKNLIGYAEAQNLCFIVGLIGGGCFLASIISGYFSNYASSASYLTLPASHFEKWLCSVLIAVVIYPIVFMLFFRIMDIVFVELYRRSLDPLSVSYKDAYKAVNLFSFTGKPAQIIVEFFLNVAGIMLLGSLYFNKANFIKVAFLFCGLFLGTYLLNSATASCLFTNLDKANPFHNVFLKAGKDVGVVELPSVIFNVMDMILLYILPLILWLLSYIRLKEKEV